MGPITIKKLCTNYKGSDRNTVYVSMNFLVCDEWE